MDGTLLKIVIGIVAFGAGNLTGFIMRGAFDPKIKDKSPNTLVLIAVTFVWVTSVLVDIVNVEYETPIMLHGLMGAIVGFFYKPISTNSTNNDKPL